MRKTRLISGVIFVNVLLLLAWPLRLQSAAYVPPTSKSELTKYFEDTFSRFLDRKLTIDRLSWQSLPSMGFIGYDVRLYDRDGSVMVYSPKVTMNLSLQAILSRRLTVSELVFDHPQGVLTIGAKGGTNVNAMLADMRARKRQAHAIDSKPHRQKIAFGLIRVQNGTLNVVDARKKADIFAAPFSLNGSGNIQGLGPKTQFPFTATAVSTSSVGTTQLALSGTLGHAPNVRIGIKDLPLKMLNDYIPLHGAGNRTVDGEVTVAKDSSTFVWGARLNTNEIKTTSGSLPQIILKARVRPKSSSIVQATFTGEPSQVKVFADIHIGKPSRVALKISSEKAEASELLAWTNAAEELAKNSGSEKRHWEFIGPCDLSCTLQSTMDKDFVANAAGVADISSADGVIKNAPGFLKSLSELNLKTLLDKKYRDKQGLPYQEMHAHFRLAGGLAILDQPAIIRNESLQIGATGNLNLVQKRIDTKIAVQVTTFADELVSLIPGVRWVLMGKKKSMVPVWVNIRGPFDSPRVNVLQAKTISAPLVDAIRNVFAIPERASEKSPAPNRS